MTTPTPAELAKELLALVHKHEAAKAEADASWKDHSVPFSGSEIKDREVKRAADAVMKACAPDRIAVLCKAIVEQPSPNKLLGELVNAINDAKSLEQLRADVNKRFPAFHCNPPFHTMSAESKGALLNIVDAVREQFKPVEALPVEARPDMSLSAEALADINAIEDAMRQPLPDIPLGTPTTPSPDDAEEVARAIVEIIQDAHGNLYLDHETVIAPAVNKIAALLRSRGAGRTPDGSCPKCGEANSSAQGLCGDISGCPLRKEERT